MREQDRGNSINGSGKDDSDAGQRSMTSSTTRRMIDETALVVLSAMIGDYE